MDGPLEASQDESLLLHDHSSYTIVHTSEDQDQEGLAKDISSINKEVSNFIYLNFNLSLFSFETKTGR